MLKIRPEKACTFYCYGEYIALVKKRTKQTLDMLKLVPYKHGISYRSTHGYRQRHSGGVSQLWREALLANGRGFVREHQFKNLSLTAILISMRPLFLQGGSYMVRVVRGKLRAPERRQVGARHDDSSAGCKSSSRERTRDPRRCYSVPSSKIHDGMRESHCLRLRKSPNALRQTQDVSLYWLNWDKSLATM